MKRPFEDYLHDWWKYKLTVETDKGPISVKWSDANNLAKWSNMQAGLYLQAENSLQVFYEYFPRWYQRFWDSRYEQGIFDIEDGSTIVDIGCGVSVIDLILAQYLPNSKFYLIDKEGFEFEPGVYYDENYPEYNSWEPVRDAIATTGLDSNRFVMQSPEDTFPKDVDVITSYLSWGWHYPKETYWKQVQDNLKIGGTLIMDIRFLEDRDVVKEISEEFKCEPVERLFNPTLPKHIDNMPAPEQGQPLGGRYMWTRNA